MSRLLKILSTQYKHLPARSEEEIDRRSITHISTMKNAPCAFVLLYRVNDGSACHPVSISFESDLPLEAWRIDYVSVACASNPNGECGYESSAPGLFPDLLMPRPITPIIEARPSAWGGQTYYEKDTRNLLNATGTAFQALYVSVNEKRAVLSHGEYSVKIKMTSLNTGELFEEESVRVTLIDALLPENDIFYTNWFHVDSLCDTFGVLPYSDAFYEIFDEYVANMTRHRQNTLLLPAFTPHLDTPIGNERMNVQLVEVSRDQDGFHFSFEKMRRFVRHAMQNGIKIFEHCHLFSQWGAYGAPNIYLADGTRIFSIETNAQDEEYVSFIRAYLKEFLAFAESEGIADSLLFHLSDEPMPKQLDSYTHAHQAVCDILKGKTIADAMTDPIFYEKGVVDLPIVDVAHTEAFSGKCSSLCLYYTGGYNEKGCANRLITNTAARTRVLGVQLYRYQALGFLHWAYNYHYDRLSQGIFSPLSDVCGYKNYPGLPFLAYPMTGKGTPCVLPSLREKLMAEAVDDLCTLKLLEGLIGREKTLALCEKKLGKITAQTIPEEDDLYELREEINRLIAEQSSLQA